MGTIDGKKLRDALAKARNVGLVEESFTIEGCGITLRNLRPEEYTAVLQECQGLNDVEYLHTYQKGHIARSIVVLNDVDFHGVEFVEDEEPDPKKPERLRTIKVELHAYLLKHVISTWSKEAIYTAYRKFGDVVEKAERQAKNGINFLLPEETEEEKYRRLLLEAKECEESLPGTLVDRILDELGLMRKSTAEEIKASTENLDKLVREQEAAEAADPHPDPEPPDPEPPGLAQPVPTAGEPVRVMAARIPADPHQTLQQAIAARKQPLPPVVQASPTPAPDTASSRAAQIAALETLPATLPGPHGPIEVHRPEHPPEPVELNQRQQPFDPKAAMAILDQPPAAGINPRFRPPPRA